MKCMFHLSVLSSTSAFSIIGKKSRCVERCNQLPFKVAVNSRRAACIENCGPAGAAKPLVEANGALEPNKVETSQDSGACQEKKETVTDTQNFLLIGFTNVLAHLTGDINDAMNTDALSFETKHIPTNETVDSMELVKATQDDTAVLTETEVSNQPADAFSETKETESVVNELPQTSFVVDTNTVVDVDPTSAIKVGPRDGPNDAVNTAIPCLENETVASNKTRSTSAHLDSKDIAQAAQNDIAAMPESIVKTNGLKFDESRGTESGVNEPLQTSIDANATVNFDPVTYLPIGFTDVTSR